MTMRVALENFALHLCSGGLGSDETGRDMCFAYLDRITEIRSSLYRNVSRSFCGQCGMEITGTNHRGKCPAEVPR